MSLIVYLKALDVYIFLFLSYGCIMSVHMMKNYLWAKEMQRVELITD